MLSLKTLVRVSAAVVVLAATPGLCLAAEGGEKGDVLSPNLVNSIVTLIVFAALFGFLATVAWPKIQAGLAAREEAQFRALNEAKRAQQEAEAMRGRLAQEMDAAAAKIKAMLDEARRDADALKAGEREVGTKEAAAIIERANREIEANRSAMIKDVYEQAVKLAALMSEKTLRRSVSEADHRRLLDESIAELRDSANKA
jgi:F-type H+-transporting ATPase subunit b